MRKKIGQGIHVGSTSILVIFILLCLMSFSALAMISAQNDYQFSRQTADHVQEYYEANNEAEEILNNIDKLLQKQYKESQDEVGFYEAISEELNGADIDVLSERAVISYEVAVSDDQKLKVSIDVIYNNEGMPLYEIKKWDVEAVESMIFEEEQPALMF